MAKSLTLIGMVQSIETDHWHKGGAVIVLKTESGALARIPVNQDDARGLSLGDRFIAEFLLSPVIDAIRC